MLNTRYGKQWYHWAASFGVFFCVLVLVGMSARAEPLRQILRLETGMHRAPILRIDTNTAEDKLATVSEDGTARLWSLPGAELLRTFRAPIGTDGGERLGAVALSPDGTMLAMAGARAGDMTLPAIYVQDTAKGKMLRRLRDLPAQVNHMTFSRDGKFLAAVMGGHSGLRVFKVGSNHEFSPIASDGGYASASYWADFDRDGRLATTAVDGTIRLYDRDFRLITKATVTKGKHPYGVAFSPDGQWLAVGYVDSSQVDVLSGSTLSLQFSPDDTIPTGSTGTLNSVAWSADGNTLLAAGRYQNRAGIKLLRKWRNGGHSPATDVAATNGTIMALRSLKTGGVVMGAADPAIRLIPEEGSEAIQRRNHAADFRNIGQRLTLSGDGRQIGFMLDGSRHLAAAFSPVDQRLVPNPPADTSLLAPVMKAAGMALGEWKVGRRPSVNGHLLPLEGDEIALSMAVAHNHHLVVGTSRRLRMFDDRGVASWQQLAPGPVMAVNAAPDGRLVVAAYGDGTIRWHRANDGQELLALFPYDDAKRWISWTPSGYYVASPDGDDLLGWQIDNGRDAAPDFLPASRFRDRFHRPDIIARVLDTLDEAKTVAAANKASERQDASSAHGPLGDLRKSLPPVVTITDPADGAAATARNVTISFTVDSRSGQPITRAFALIDGRPVAGAAGEQSAPEPGENLRLTFPLPARSVAVSILAETASATATPATIHLRGFGAGAETGGMPPPPARLVILAVGTGGAGTSETLMGRDAIAAVETLRAREGVSYHTVSARLLTDSKATYRAVTDGLNWLGHEVQPDDLVLVLWRAPVTESTDGRPYFLCADSDPAQFNETSVSIDRMREALRSLPGQVVLFLDAPQPPPASPGKAVAHPANIDHVAESLATPAIGVVVVAATSGDEISHDMPDHRSGTFLKAFLESLPEVGSQVSAPPLTLRSLGHWLKERVPQLTNDSQHPRLWQPPTIPNFIVVRSDRL